MFQGYSKSCLMRSEGDENMSSQMCHFGSGILYELEEIKTQKLGESFLSLPCLCVLVAQSHLCNPSDCSVHRDFPGKNTGMGCPALLQGIASTQGLNPDLLHCEQILFHLSHP